jgi:hypothetical protein
MTWLKMKLTTFDPLQSEIDLFISSNKCHFPEVVNSILFESRECSKMLCLVRYIALTAFPQSML